jgi:hypothetical protein
MAKIVFKRCSLTLDLATIERCKRLAAEKGQSVSSLVRYLVAEACEHATAAKRREVTGEGR